MAALAAAYLEHHRTGAAEEFWASEEVGERVGRREAEPDDAWTIILALVAAADEANLGHVGAGPLEDFVRRFGPRIIDRLEAQALHDPKFRSCLSRIWLSHGDLPADVVNRVVVASHGPRKPRRSRGA